MTDDAPTDSSPGWKQITAERERWWNGRQWTETYRERKTS